MYCQGVSLEGGQPSGGRSAGGGGGGGGVHDDDMYMTPKKPSPLRRARPKNTVPIAHPENTGSLTAGHLSEICRTHFLSTSAPLTAHVTA